MLLSLNSKNFGLAEGISTIITACQIHIKETSKIKKLITLGHNIPDMSTVLTTNQHENLELEPSGRIIPLD
jgi:hypothetical protein